MLRSGAVLLNFSRDGVVDEEAVLEGRSRASACKWYVTDFPSPRPARRARA